MTNREIIAEVARVLQVQTRDLAIGNKRNGKTMYVNRYDLADYPEGKEVAKYEPWSGKLEVYHI